MTRTTPREAILKAADHIEAHPELFKFSETEIPHVCGTPGCALGWIGYFGLRLKDGYNSFNDAAQNFLSLPAEKQARAINEYRESACAYAFYNRMEEFSNYWMHSAKECAYALRLYADKYHPIDGTDYIPQAVRDIFAKPSELITT